MIHAHRNALWHAQNIADNLCVCSIRPATCCKSVADQSPPRFWSWGHQRCTQTAHHSSYSRHCCPVILFWLCARPVGNGGNENLA